MSPALSWARRVTAITLTAATATLFVAPAADAAPRNRSVSVRVISFNDLHGNLEPPGGSSGRVTQSDGTTVDAGGAAYLATHVKQLRAEVKNSLLVSTGDSIGGSPLPSALFHDEPTIEVLNAMGVKASVVGNHEFDEGYRELLRIQNGGCHPTDGCQFGDSYGGADFPFLGANVTFTNGRPALLPFAIKKVGGLPIGIIGVTLKELPTVVTPEAVAGLKFGDEVQAINKTAGLLQRLGVRTQIVLLHQGDNTEGGGPNDCSTVPGVATRIATESTPTVDAFFTGHSHQQYNCVVTDPAGQPRPLIQGLSFGRLLSTVDLKINRRTRDVIRRQTVAENVVVTRTVTPDARVQAIVDRAVTESAPIANRPVGRITADIVRGTGETPMGNLVADAQLAATRGLGAQIAITNPGGLRDDLDYASSPAGEGDGVVTYGEAYSVQPFANIMQVITLTGAQLDAVLEQQAPPVQTSARILQISAGFSYTWSASAPAGSKASDLTLNGEPIDPTASYRVAVNNFLAAGGDNFTVFAQGTDLVGGPIDLDAFTAYLEANQPVSPPATDRINEVP